MNGAVGLPRCILLHSLTVRRQSETYNIPQLKKLPAGQGGDLPPLLSPREATPGVLCPFLGSLLKEGDRATGLSSEKDYEDD